jgi:hypothetical protein
MKRLFKNTLFALCLVVTIFSVMSISITAEEIEKKANNNYEVRGEVIPRVRYVEDHPWYSSNGLPPKTKYFGNIKIDGFYYSGTLTLTEYQPTGDGGYLGLYSGYVRR